MLSLISLVLYLLTWGVFFNTEEGNVTFSIAGICLVSIISLVTIIKKYNKIHVILIVAYLLRIIVLFLDYYKIPILHSGADTEAFYEIAKYNVSNAIGNQYQLTNYTVFLTYLFKLIGAQRLMAQFINVLLSMCTLIYTYKSLKLCSVKSKYIYSVLWLAAIMPNQVILSSILLRESIIISSFTVSIYYLIKWLKDNKTLNMFLALFFIVISSIMHSGMVGILFGYILSFVLFNHQKQRLVITKKSLISLLIFAIPVVVISSLVISASPYLKFLVDSGGEAKTDLILESINQESDGFSAYLTWIKYDSIFKLIIFLPLKILHFICSPLPWYWRGFSDIIAFFLDGLIFGYIFFLIYHKRNNNLHIIRAIMIGIWFSVAIYAYGTNTAGTAMRHRANFFPVLLICAVLSRESSQLPTNILPKKAN